MGVPGGERPSEQSRAEVTAGHPLGVALGLLRSNAPGKIMGAPQSWPAWAVLLPHVLAATAHLDPAVSDPPVRDNAAWLLDRAGSYLRVHARLADARPLAERALAINEAAYGANHPEVATDLSNLATILRTLGQPGQARPLAERAQGIWRKTEASHPTPAEQEGEA